MKPTSSTQEFDEQQMLRGMKWYLTALVRAEFEQEKAEFHAEVQKSITFIVDETNKLNKIARKLDKYITSGLELKG